MVDAARFSGTLVPILWIPWYYIAEDCNLTTVKLGVFDSEGTNLKACKIKKSVTSKKSKCVAIEIKYTELMVYYIKTVL